MCKRKFLKCRIILDNNEIHVFVIKSTKINVCLIVSISNQQIDLIEKYLEEELSKRIENFSMGEFTKTIMYVLYLFIWHLLLLFCHISYTYQDAKDRAFEISLQQLIFQGTQKWTWRWNLWDASDLQWLYVFQRNVPGLQSCKTCICL